MLFNVTLCDSYKDNFNALEPPILLTNDFSLKKSAVNFYFLLPNWVG